MFRGYTGMFWYKSLFDSVLRVVLCLFYSGKSCNFMVQKEKEEVTDGQVNHFGTQR